MHWSLSVCLHISGERGRAGRMKRWKLLLNTSCMPDTTWSISELSESSQYPTDYYARFQKKCPEPIAQMRTLRCSYISPLKKMFGSFIKTKPRQMGWGNQSIFGLNETSEIQSILLIWELRWFAWGHTANKILHYNWYRKLQTKITAFIFPCRRLYTAFVSSSFHGKPSSFPARCLFCY